MKDVEKTCADGTGAAPGGEDSKADKARKPVGFFDSGKGGLCILEAFKTLCPGESTVYMADSAHCPYGNRSKEEIIALALANTRWLLNKYGCKMIVVACNTATAAAIDILREKFPSTPFIGIEPAVKPAVLDSRTAVVGVLATAGTFSGRLYNETKRKFAHDVTVIATVADEFVELVEAGKTEGDEVEAAVRKRLEPLLAAGADQIVLGCTHFPHLKKTMEKVCGRKAKIIDPSLAVARRARQVLKERHIAAPDGAPVQDVRISSDDAQRPTVLVTGGTIRLGKAIADRLAETGWKVLRSSHRAGAGADIVADLSRPGGADELFDKACEILGAPPGAIVNNAAVYLSDPFTTEMVNFASPVRLMERLALENPGASVVNILDAAVVNGHAEKRKQFMEYAKAKSRLRDATLGSGERFGGKLNASAVAPGPVLAPTGIHEKAKLPPGVRRPTPLDVAEAVRNLLESKAAFEIIRV